MYCRAKACVYLMVLNSKGFCGFFSRSKIEALAFLIDYNAKTSYKRIISGAKYFKTNGTPFSKEISRSIDWLTDWEIEDMGNHFIPGTKPRFHPFCYVTPHQNNLMVDVMLKYGEKKDDELREEIMNLPPVKEAYYGKVVLV